MDAPAKLQTKSGFSLIETVISLGILTVALSCLLTNLPAIINNRSNIEHNTQASLIAESLLAEISAFGRLTENGATLLPANSEAKTCLAALDSKGNLLRILEPNSYANGDRQADYLTAIYTKHRATDPPGLIDTEVSIEWPAAAKDSVRKHQFYHTLILCP